MLIVDTGDTGNAEAKSSVQYRDLKGYPHWAIV